jgi:cell division protein FtsQ
LRGALVTTLLLVLFLTGMYLFLISCRWFGLTEIEISGDTDLTLNEVTELTPVLLGTSVFRLDAQKIENGIRKDLRLSQAKVIRKFPNKIKIKLQRKRPIFLINLDQLYGLTKTKEIIPSEAQNQRLDLPILSGVSVGQINFYQETDIPEIQKAIDFYQTAVTLDSTFLGKISELDLSHPDNLILYLLPSGLRVVMGSGDYAQRLARLIEVLKVEQDLERLSWIDLRFHNQAIVKSRKLQVKEYES